MGGGFADRPCLAILLTRLVFWLALLPLLPGFWAVLFPSCSQVHERQADCRDVRLFSR
jgi:hypothetical protein